MGRGGGWRGQATAAPQPPPPAHLRLSASGSPGAGGSFSCSSRELSTATGLQVGDAVAKRAASSSSRWGDPASIRPRRTAGKRACSASLQLRGRARAGPGPPDSGTDGPGLFDQGRSLPADRRSWPQAPFWGHLGEGPLGSAARLGVLTVPGPELPLPTSSGSTPHFSPDLRVATTARTVELTTSESPWNAKASARRRSPLRAAGRRACDPGSGAGPRPRSPACPPPRRPPPHFPLRLPLCSPQPQFSNPWATSTLTPTQGPHSPTADTPKRTGPSPLPPGKGQQARGPHHR